jgi:hypothetical protein
MEERSSRAADAKRQTDITVGHREGERLDNSFMRVASG